MSFFPIPEKASKQQIARIDLPMLHAMECNACPLASITSNRHPNMPATGCEDPLIYCLGEAPGREEDEKGRQFVGQSGQLLRDLIPKDLFKRIRWNNVVRTRPIANETPTFHAIECCRPSVVRDIERSRPKAIFGFGNTPLQWLTGYTGINAYRGRRLPVKVGEWSCWFYPMLHPAAILHQTSRGYVYDMDDDDDGDNIANEDHRILEFDIQRACDELEKLPNAFVHDAQLALERTKIITEYTNASLDEIERLLTVAGKLPALGVDYETNDLRPYASGSKILTAAVSDGSNSLSIPFDHMGADWSLKQRRRLDDIWYKFLKTAEAIKIVHNLQFEMEWTGEIYGPELLRAGKWECTQVQASILDQRYKGTKPGPLSLEFLVLQYFGLNIKKLANVDRMKLSETPLPHVLQYNALDAKYHIRLFGKQDERITAEGLGRAYKLARRRVPTLVLAQLRGIPVDQNEVIKLKTKYDKRIVETKAAIAKEPLIKKFEKEFGHEFDAGKHCVKLFYTMERNKKCEVFDKKKRNVTSWKGGVDGKTTVNKISCDEGVLEEIGGSLPEKIIMLRKAQKRLSTYIEPMLEGGKVLWPDGLMHPTYNHTFTDTGRLSAEDPNIQNYPSREDEAKEVRRPIKARKGRKILAIDYGQIEARVIAMYSKDKYFIKTLWDRYDVHGDWAERIAYEIPRRIGGRQFLKDKAILKKFRTDIKNQWTFPLFFGAKLESVCHYLSQPCDYIPNRTYAVEPEDLTDLYDKFWDEFQGVKQWQDRLIKFYHENGYVETFTGRRRYGPMSVNKVINSPVQGFTAELVMDGMNRLSETGDPLLQPEIQIHDDITWVDVPEEKVDEVAERAIEILIKPKFDCINVPITLELKFGDNWLDMEEIGAFSSDEWNK